MEAVDGNLCQMSGYKFSVCTYEFAGISGNEIGRN